MAFGLDEGGVVEVGGMVVAAVAVVVGVDIHAGAAVGVVGKKRCAVSAAICIGWALVGLLGLVVWWMKEDDDG